MNKKNKFLAVLATAVAISGTGFSVAHCAYSEEQVNSFATTITDNNADYVGIVKTLLGLDYETLLSLIGSDGTPDISKLNATQKTDLANKLDALGYTYTKNGDEFTITKKSDGSVVMDYAALKSNLQEIKTYVADSGNSTGGGSSSGSYTSLFSSGTTTNTTTNTTTTTQASEVQLTTAPIASTTTLTATEVASGVKILDKIKDIIGSTTNKAVVIENPDKNARWCFETKDIKDAKALEGFTFNAGVNVVSSASNNAAYQSAISAAPAVIQEAAKGKNAIVVDMAMPDSVQKGTDGKLSVTPLPLMSTLEVNLGSGYAGKTAYVYFVSGGQVFKFATTAGTQNYEKAVISKDGKVIFKVNQGGKYFIVIQ